MLSTRGVTAHVAAPEPLPARRGGRPSSEQAALLGDRILDVAADWFLTEGYGATSIEAVAQRAKISKRTFYHRFPDKAALFDETVQKAGGCYGTARSL